MRAFLGLSCLLGLASGQYHSPRNAAILSDARYLAGDGTFGAAYTQEDGVEFKEESDVNGDRRGSYSYVDPTGHRRTVTYTAGKNGFQATGDGIPNPPPQVPPQPEYTPLPQYNPPDYQPPSYNPTEPSYQQRPYPSYQQRPYPSRPQLQPSYQPRAEPQPHLSQQQFSQPHLSQHVSQHVSQQQLSQQQQQPSYQPEPELQGIPSYGNVAEYQRQAPVSSYNAITTPAPRRFYPPGKLSFNRTPDGFSYTFSKS